MSVTFEGNLISFAIGADPDPGAMAVVIISLTGDREKEEDAVVFQLWNGVKSVKYISCTDELLFSHFIFSFFTFRIFLPP